MDSGRGDPEALLEPADESLADDEAFVSVLESLRDEGSYSVIVQRGDGEDGRALAAGSAPAAAATNAPSTWPGRSTTRTTPRPADPRSSTG